MLRIIKEGEAMPQSLGRESLTVYSVQQQKCLERRRYDIGTVDN